MHDAFEQFTAFPIDNQALLASHGKLDMPVLAIGAEKSYGIHVADILRNVAKNVTGYVIVNSGHWVMEEQPTTTTTTTVVERFAREH